MIGTGHGHAPVACASENPATSPALVHVLPIGNTIRAGGGASPAVTCSAISNAADIAPSVPIGVAPPGGITTERRSRRAIRRPANGTSTTWRSRTSSHSEPTSALAFSCAHSLCGCGNRIAPASSPIARAWSTVAIA